MSEEKAKSSLMESGSSRVVQKRKRKISENTLQNGINSMLIPNESKYWMRSKKSDNHTVVVRTFYNILSHI